MATPAEKRELAAAWLKELERPSKTLTQWELDFLESITDQLDQGRILTDKQMDKLESIYAEKTA